MRNAVVSILVCLAVGALKSAHAQQPIFKNYTVNDGLVSSSIRRIFQDSRGFIWIATWEGVSQYDGHRFTNYNTSNGLSHSLVNDLFEMPGGRMYIALNNGMIDVIEQGKVAAAAVATPAVINSFVSSEVHPLLATTDAGGLLEIKDGKITQPQQAHPHSSYHDLLWLSDSTLLAVGDSMICVFNEHYELVTETTETYAKYTGAKIYQDLKKRIWIGTYNGMLLLQYNAGRKTLLFPAVQPTLNIPALSKRQINDIFEDDKGFLWIATGGGLVRINPDGTPQSITVREGLASNIISNIFQDREKNIWFGTAVGVSKLVSSSGISLYAIANGIWSNNNAYLLLPFHENYLLVSTPAGAQAFNKTTGTFTALSKSGKNFLYSHVASTAPPILLGLKGLARLDRESMELEPTVPLPSPKATRVLKDRQGNFLSGDLEHLYFSSGAFTTSLLDFRISGLLQDSSGVVWAGTWQNGLFKIAYSFENNRLHILSKQQVLPAENIRCLWKDARGNIWVGTRYHGLFRISKNGQGKLVSMHFDQTNGLTSNFIRSVAGDAKGNVWVGFSQGLDKLIPSGRGFRVFNFSRVHNYFTSVVGLLADADNSLWLATGEGLVHIKDRELEKLPPPPVYITRVQSGNATFNVDNETKELNYQQKQVAFEFSSPGFVNEKQVLYSYRLAENETTAWSTAANEHAVSYANLQAGSYQFEVRTLGWNGQWGTPATFRFTIEPPLWQTWWFRLAVMAAGILLLYIGLRKRIQTVRRESSLKQKIAETEMMALRAQMNPHFIFNCLNSIDNLIQTEDKEKATLYLSKFAKLIRFILENAAQNRVPCWKDMETMQLYLELESLRFDHRFTYQLSIAAEILNGDYKVPPLIVQPYLENAIHHGLLNKLDGDKKLKVEVYASANHVHYVIEDNGIGRKQAATYKQNNTLAYASMGMQLTEERINHFNQQQHGAVQIEDLFDENNQPRGTKVSIAVNVHL